MSSPSREEVLPILDDTSEWSLPPSSPDLPLHDLLSLPGLYTLPSPGSSQPSSPAALADNDPPSELSIIPSSPVRTASDAVRKSWKARKARMDAERAQDDAERQAEASKTFKAVLDILSEKKLTFGDLVVYVSDAENYRGRDRYWGFFSVEGRVEQVLDAWVSSQNSQTGKRCVHQWAVNYVKRVVHTEGDSATQSKILRTSAMNIDTTFSRDFSLTNLHTRLLALCPTMMSILEAFSTTAKQTREMSDISRKRKNNYVATEALIALAARSQANSYTRHVLGLYAYASGAQRQVISVLSHLGLTVSYPTLVGRGKSKMPSTSVACTGTTLEGTGTAAAQKDSASQDIESDIDDIHGDEDGASAVNSDDEYWSQLEPIAQDTTTEDGPSASVDTNNGGEDQGASPDAPPGSAEKSTRRKTTKGSAAAVGLLKRLSDACRRRSRDAALTKLLAYVYDNINMMFKVAEQVLGRKDSQQNGTCATAFKLFEASPEDMKTADLLGSFVDAPSLSLDDIILTREENDALTARLTHTILRIIVNYGGDKFARFRTDIVSSTPATLDKIPVHETEIFPLPAMHIDESSTTGNADVLSEIFSEVGLDMDSTDFTSTIKITAGDQLSISRIRSLVANRAGHDSFGRSFLWAVCMPGLFHYKMAATHAVLESHFGSSATYDPGSLAFHNTRLDRKPLVLSSLPAFRTCRDLIFVSLYARVLHCLQRVSNCDDLAEYAENVTFDELQTHAQAIIDQFATPARAEEQRRQRNTERRKHYRDADADANTGTHDPSSANALVLREFNDAIKAGDSGRVVTVLKLWALAFRGSGRLKYAYELLHLIHNLTHVWPEPLRKIILKNWLVNPTGKEDSWVEVDLMQEHLNFWTKNVYQAHGSNASWEWLQTISPCINILRRLATQINQDLGSRQGSKHTTPDLDFDIHELMDSLAHHRVYDIEPGRTISSEKPTVLNAVSAGLGQLAGPLADFNAQVRRLQARCQMTPVVGRPYIDRPETHGSTPAVALDSSAPSQSVNEGPTTEASAAARDGAPLVNVAIAATSDGQVDIAAEADSDDELYWTVFDDEPAMFSLDTAGDVALDMDVLEDV
ncbi:hypothetical protein ONZ51_g10984 [Trametes cubensis]|uniref:DUF6589 domain-containing protein n=1 Tax=Trametes cubensis TaxID=1111947 RepID=A0AAD7X4E8_9APHY|nr:hypothetical protein ONZ51_g10984 [Trametes cubensis]